MQRPFSVFGKDFAISRREFFITTLFLIGLFFALQWVVEETIRAVAVVINIMDGLESPRRGSLFYAGSRVNRYVAPLAFIVLALLFVRILINRLGTVGFRKNLQKFGFGLAIIPPFFIGIVRLKIFGWQRRNEDHPLSLLTEFILENHKWWLIVGTALLLFLVVYPGSQAKEGDDRTNRMWELKDLVLFPVVAAKRFFQVFGLMNGAGRAINGRVFLVHSLALVGFYFSFLWVVILFSRLLIYILAPSGEPAFGALMALFPALAYNFLNPLIVPLLVFMFIWLVWKRLAAFIADSRIRTFNIIFALLGVAPIGLNVWSVIVPQLHLLGGPPDWLYPLLNTYPLMPIFLDAYTITFIATLSLPHREDLKQRSSKPK